MNATIIYLFFFIGGSPEAAAKSIQIKSPSCCVHQKTAKELIHLDVCSPFVPKLNINGLHEDEDEDVQAVNMLLHQAGQVPPQESLAGVYPG